MSSLNEDSCSQVSIDAGQCSPVSRIPFLKSCLREAKDQTALALPAALAAISNRFTALVSVMVVGRLGTNELAAAALAITFANCSGMSIVVGFTNALHTIASQAYGARHMKNVSLSL